MVHSSEKPKLTRGALAGDKWAIGRLLSLFEDKRKQSITERAEVLKILAQSREKRKARFFGFTGPPGVGKSSLILSLTRRILKEERELRIAVLAVDPSSALSGGSFLGDRQRMLTYSIMGKEKERFFFRSQSAGQNLGGLSQSSFIVARLLYYLFDWVCVETVGIGQNEIEIQFLADCTILLLQPSSGDHIQFLKAGIMESPDIFVFNKCDLDISDRSLPSSLERSLQDLKNSLLLNRPNKEYDEIPVLLSSAHTGQGISELAERLLEFTKCSRTWQDKEAYYFTKWVRYEFGRQGLSELRGSEKEILRKHSSFEAAQLYVWERLSSNKAAFK